MLVIDISLSLVVLSNAGASLRSGHEGRSEPPFRVVRRGSPARPGMDSIKMKRLLDQFDRGAYGQCQPSQERILALHSARPTATE